MFQSIVWLVVIMGAVPIFVNAATDTVDAGQLQSFVEQVLSKGSDDPISANFATVLRFDHALPSKSEGTDPEEAQDSLDRNCYLVTEPSEKGPKPVCLLFKAKQKKAHTMKERWVKLGLDGKPELVAIVNGKYDESGQAVRGSGEATYLDLKSKEAKEIIKYELDYWLHNMHRTKLGKLRLTNPNATMADVKTVEHHAASAHAELNSGGGGASSDSSSIAEPQTR